jgi:hypothetical protein
VGFQRIGERLMSVFNTPVIVESHYNDSIEITKFQSSRRGCCWWPCNLSRRTIARTQSHGHFRQSHSIPLAISVIMIHFRLLGVTCCLVGPFWLNFSAPFIKLGLISHVTSWQGMLSPLRHPISTLVFARFLILYSMSELRDWSSYNL